MDSLCEAPPLSSSSKIYASSKSKLFQEDKFLVFNFQSVIITPKNNYARWLGASLINELKSREVKVT